MNVQELHCTLGFTVSDTDAQVTRSIACRLHAGRRHEIAEDIYRISTPIPPEAIPGGFTFNQFLIADEAPLLYHTGLRSLFPAVREAVASVIPVDSLRYLAFSHFEADECGALNDFLDLAPEAEPVCSAVAKMVSVDDIAHRPARGLGDRRHRL